MLVLRCSCLCWLLVDWYALAIFAFCLMLRYPLYVVAVASLILVDILLFTNLPPRRYGIRLADPPSLESCALK
jgi:hypothetical protein